MKSRTILLFAITFLLFMGIMGCEKDTSIDLPKKPCAELDENHTTFIMEIKNVKGVVEKHEYISFGESYFYVKVKTEDIFGNEGDITDVAIPNFLDIYLACNILNEHNIGDVVNISGSLYYTIGDPGQYYNSKMIAYVYVLKN